MKRVDKTLKIDPTVWKEVKVHCAKEEITISKYAEDLFKKDLKIDKQKKKQ